MGIMYFCSYGHYSNGCPTCDSPTFSDELLFFNSVEEYANRVWKMCCDEELGMLYSCKSKSPLFENVKHLGRHSCISCIIRDCETNQTIFQVYDDGHGNKDLYRVEDNVLVSDLIKE